MSSPCEGVIILAGGTGKRLGGVSKPDVLIAGHRLIDLAVDNLPETDHIVAVAPDTVQMPPGVAQVVEDPPLSGPAAGVAAGWHYLRQYITDGTDHIGLIPTDAPLAGLVLAHLSAALDDTDVDAAIAYANGFVQRTVVVFTADGLAHVTDGPCHNVSLRKVLNRITTVTVPVDDRYIIDVDTPEDKQLLARELSHVTEDAADRRRHRHT